MIPLEDSGIIQLYWERDERAIPATSKKYGRYCTSIARNILGSEEDAEECVNDTYLRAWNAMPPQRPDSLGAFLGRITRNLAIDRYRRERSVRRGGGELPAVLSELCECVSNSGDTEEALDHRELTRAIEAFLDALSPAQRRIFVSRYWYADSVSDIAARHGIRAGTVSMTLSRLRAKLRRHLLREGFLP